MTSACGGPSRSFCFIAHFAYFGIKIWCGSTVCAEKARNSHLLHAKSFVQPPNFEAPAVFLCGLPTWMRFFDGGEARRLVAPSPVSTLTGLHISDG